jgi:dipeptidyl aminopeptidase/acylaminoacyl peptidase
MQPVGTMFKRFCVLLAVVSFTFPQSVLAQGKPEDYKRANAFSELVRDKVFNNPTTVSWIEKQNKFWYMNTTSAGKEFVLVDAAKAQKKPAFDHSKMAAALAKASGNDVKANQLPFNVIRFVDDKTLEVVAFNKTWQVNLSNFKVEDKGAVENTNPFGRRPGGAAAGYWGSSRDDSRGEGTPSPDGKWVALIKNNNVYIHPTGKPREEIQMSFDGSPGEYYSAMISWSPDSRKLATNRVRPNTPRTLYLLESSPSTQLQPILQTRNYLKPGDALPQNNPVLFDVESRKSFAVDPSLIADQYGLSRLEWRKDSRAFTFEYNKRGHQQYSVFSVDAQSGKTSALIDERSKTFVEYSGKKYRRDVNDGKEIIWASERDGWNHLYLYDGTTGKVKNQITKGEWVVRKVVHVDEEKRTILFTGSGKIKGQDPYLLQYYRINFDGTGLTELTNENASHTAVFNEDYSYFVDTYSRADMPPVKVLRSGKDGKVLLELEKADISALEAAGWKNTEVFSAKGRDGETDIWGIIVRPTNFDPAKTYPVIEYIYAGPHDSFVPKTFSTNPSGMGPLAELGFIVVQIDGMGTSNRSKAFHDVAWQNLKDAGFPDRIAWMKEANKKYPYMDINRVGIYGTSAGGQSSTGAVLFHPEFYKVAVSSCGCHDNRMDKMWWNEQWMGYPIGEHYAASSNVVNAHKLEGKLMLIVGELDDNVDPASTYQVVDALIKANKEHELIMVPGMGHSSGGNYGEHKRRDYFVKHLLGVDPPVWEGQKATF